MPEVAEVYTMASQMRSFLGNDITLNSINFLQSVGARTKNSGYNNMETIKSVLPCTIHKIYSKGKKIIIENTDKLYVVISPLMTGGIVFKQMDYTKVHFTFGVNPSKKIEADKKLKDIDADSKNDNSDNKNHDNDSKDNVINIYFDDKLNWGLVDVFFTKNSFDEKMKEIGPDWINDNITYDFFKSKITYSRIKNNQIVQFLMNQKYISGIGNYLKAEILYNSKIRPDRLLQDLSETDIINLYNSCVQIVKLSLESNGLTIKDYHTPCGETGSFDTCVYNKKKDPLGNDVITGKFKDAERTTHWCPSVQI
jgi:formamidopyrimidine-DNA glycosylase